MPETVSRLGFSGGARGPAPARVAVILVAAGLSLAMTPAARPALAGASEDKLLSITKTTVYGAMLGGLLGVASALIVRKGYEDDAIRWGVALGSFAGFAYGITSKEETTDDLSFLSVPRAGPVPIRLSLADGVNHRPAAGFSIPASPEVLHGCLEEEGAGLQGKEGRSGSREGPGKEGPRPRFGP